MKVVVLYRPDSGHGRVAEEFIHDYRTNHPDTVIEVMNIDTREGGALAALYDIVQYPAILVLQSNGYLHKMWQGAELPRIDEVASYAYS